MSKKHRTTFNVKPQPSVPNTLRASVPPRGLDSQELLQHHENDSLSVNELINRNRKESSRGTPTVATNMQRPSVPPAVRAILELPEMAGPKPRSGTRAGSSHMRRIPGPPPPESWLTKTSHAPKNASKLNKPTARTDKIRQVYCTLPGASFPASSSLRHQALKSAAVAWQWQLDNYHEDLPCLPNHLKEVLLSYISLYSDCSIFESLNVLFPPASQQDPTIDLLEIERLDLTNAITPSVSMAQLKRRLICPKSARRTSTTASFSMQDNEVPDSWDASSDSTDGQAQDPGSTFWLSLEPVLRFPKLRYLSLALRPEFSDVAKWSELISAAPTLSTITHLSLAFWPNPSYTPNAAATRVTVNNPISPSIPGVVYGGTNIYSPFCNDWKEAAGILRSLSRSLYCLKWLDLTGCKDWWPALAWQSSSTTRLVGDIIPYNSTYPEVPSSDSDTSAGPEWNGSWRGVEHITMKSGCTPTEIAQPTGAVETLTDPVRMIRDEETGSPKYYNPKDVENQRRIMRQARIAAKQLQDVRKMGCGKWIEFDFGEEPE